ncbi:MAG: hypothetical protein LBI31_02090 [Zoogloeaceae bacterium]|jgi:hypothetical protein|nr:hypothetical protein [Zoogloeaceae bacterium]
MLEIPFSDAPAQVFQTELDGRRLEFTALWNDRSNVWTMDIADAITGEVLAKSLPIVLGQDILAAYNFGLGALVAVDTGNTGMDAGPDDLGQRVKVWWMSPEELLTD